MQGARASGDSPEMPRITSHDKLNDSDGPDDGNEESKGLDEAAAVLADALKGVNPAIMAYARIIARFPRIFLAGSLCFMLFISSIGVLIHGVDLDFSTPEKGFDARGTKLAGRLISFMKLLQSEVCNGHVSLLPDGRPTPTIWFLPDGSTAEGYCDPGSDYFRHFSKDSGSSPLPDLPYPNSSFWLDDGGGSGHRRRRRLELPIQSDKSSTSATRSLGHHSYQPCIDYQNSFNIVLVLTSAKSKGSLLDADSLRQSCTFDDDVRQFPGFEKYCLRGPFGECCESRSLGRYIAAWSGTTCDLINDEHVAYASELFELCYPWFENSTIGNCLTSSVLCPQRIPSVCIDLMVWDAFHALMSDQYRPGREADSSNRLAYMKLEVPADENNEWFRKLSDDLLEPMYYTNDGVLSHGGHLDFAGYSFHNKYWLFGKVILEDLSYAGLAFSIVFCMIWFHSRSFFISSLAFIQIWCALGVAYSAYTIILRLPFFPFLNLVAVFIVIGIGADDVFVYVDHWQHSAVLVPPNIRSLSWKCMGNAKRVVRNEWDAMRVGWVLQNAGGAMLVTSLTTSAAFFSNLLSPITSIRLFGLFCGLVVLSDFVLMCTFIPAVVMCHDRFVRHWSYGQRLGLRVLRLLHLGNPRGRDSLETPEWSIVGPSPNTAIEMASLSASIPSDDQIHDGTRNYDLDLGSPIRSPLDSACSASPSSEHSLDIPFPESPRSEPPTRGRCHILERRAGSCCDSDEANSLNSDRRPIDRYLFKFAKEVVVRGRWLWVLLFTTAAVVLGVFSTRLQFSSDARLQVFHEDHPMEVYDQNLRWKFRQGGAEESYQWPVYFVWGLEPKDNGDAFDPDNFGTIQYQAGNENGGTKLDLSSKKTQQWLSDFCDAALTEPWYRAPDVKKLNGGSNCFIYQLRQWMGARCARTSSNHSSWISTSDHKHEKPLPSWTLVPKRTVCCDYSVNGTDFPYEPAEFDICLENFVTFWNSPEIAQPNLVSPTNVFYENGKIKALVIHMATSVQYENTFDSGNSFYHDVNGWFERQIESAPGHSGLRDGFFVSNFWFYAIQEALQKGASLSTLVSTAMAAAVLLVMTCNICVSFVASFTIIAIVAAETGILVLAGWTLGPIESIIFSVAVGMSIDFVSHLSHAYIHAKPPNEPWTNGEFRIWRVSESLSLMGVSISTAALSTSVAGAMMLSCTSIFFFEFGTFMVLVMVLSWVYSVFWLLPALSWLGCTFQKPKGLAKAPSSDSLHEGSPSRALPSSDGHQSYRRIRTRTQSDESAYELESPSPRTEDDYAKERSWMSPLQAVAEGGSSAEDERFGESNFGVSPNAISEVGAEEPQAQKELVGEDSFEAAMRGL